MKECYFREEERHTQMVSQHKKISLNLENVLHTKWKKYKRSFQKRRGYTHGIEF